MKVCYTNVSNTCPISTPSTISLNGSLQTIDAAAHYVHDYMQHLNLGDFYIEDFDEDATYLTFLEKRSSGFPTHNTLPTVKYTEHGMSNSFAEAAFVRYLIALILIGIVVFGIVSLATYIFKRLLKWHNRGNDNDRVKPNTSIRAKPLILKMHWLNSLAPPSHHAYDCNVYLTQHDSSIAAPMIRTMLDDTWDASIDINCAYRNKQVTKNGIRFVPHASEKCEDDYLALPTRTYPRQAHYQLSIKQQSLRRQLKNWKFGTVGSPDGRVKTALVTWMTHFSVGLVHLAQSFYALFFILLAPEKTIRSALVKPGDVVFCKNVPTNPEQSNL